MGYGKGAKPQVFQRLDSFAIVRSMKRRRRVEGLVRVEKPLRIMRKLFKGPNLDEAPERYHKLRPLRVLTFGG